MVSSMVPGSATEAPGPSGLRWLVGARRHRDGRTLRGQSLGDRASDPPAATGHQSCFTGE